MPRVVVTDRSGGEETLDFRPGDTLMQTITGAGMGDLLALCGGMCSCATCHIFVDPEWMPRLPPPQGDEKELLIELQHYDPARSRLSCQVDFTPALDGLSLEVAPDE